MLLWVALLLGWPGLGLEGQSPRGPRRARRPDWRAETPKGLFFDNAFDQALIGSRPEILDSIPDGPDDTDQTNAESTSDTEIGPWRELCSIETVELQIKQLFEGLNRSIQSPNQFASQGRVLARDQFSLLAIWFAVIEQSGQGGRFQKQASSARRRFAEVAAILQESDPKTFPAARLARDDLQELLGGGSLILPGAYREVDWYQVAPREAIMRRLESATVETLVMGRFTADSGKRSIPELEVVAVLGTILTRPEMEQADDADYQAFAEQLVAAAKKTRSAINLADAADARASLAALKRSCIDCHEMFR